MKGKLTLQRRLVLPIALLGLVILLSNLLAVFSINNVHANAGTIVDEYMVSEAKLEEIRRSIMDLHRLAHHDTYRAGDQGGGGGLGRKIGGV